MARYLDTAKLDNILESQHTSTCDNLRLPVEMYNNYKKSNSARRALLDQEQDRLLDGKVSEAGDGATASAFDGPLFSSPGLVPALADVFDNEKEALLRTTKRGLDPISLATSPKLAEKQFKTIQTLVGGAIAGADVVQAYSSIARKNDPFLTASPPRSPSVASSTGIRPRTFHP